MWPLSIPVVLLRLQRKNPSGRFWNLEGSKGWLYQSACRYWLHGRTLPAGDPEGIAGSRRGVRHWSGRRYSGSGRPYSAREHPELFPDKMLLPLCGERIQSTPPYSSYLKIAEGCDNRCSYCAIPLIRGPYRSRPMESILEEAETLAKNGTKELIVIAQDTTRYGCDLYKNGCCQNSCKSFVKWTGLCGFAFYTAIRIL